MRDAAVWGLWLVGLLVPGVVRAQPDAGSEPVLVPPRLVDFVEADYPPEAEAAGLEATVELELSIDAAGAVTDATVVEPAGHGFDEAAAAAARRFRFEPATSDGEPVPSIIRYRYLFELREPEPPPPPEEPEGGRITGRVLEADTREPILSAEVALSSSEGAVTRRAITGADGVFRFDDLPPGRYAVRVTAPDHQESTGDAQEVAAGEEVSVTTLLRRVELEEDVLEFGAVAEIDPPPREVTRHTIRRTELTRIPGTRGDALRTVEILPGVARPPFGGGVLLVRGSAPTDSDVLFEGAPVPLLYHFGGFTSFMNTRLLERIDFYPGNFSARFGRKIGGVLEVTARDPATDRFHGALETSIIDLSLIAEGPLGDHVSIAVAARRSIVDLVFSAFVPEEVDLVAAPVYEDYQLFLTWRPTDRDRFRFLLYGSRDRFRVFLRDAFQDNPAIRGDANLSTHFHYAHLAWDRRISEDVEQSLRVQVGPLGGNIGLGEIFQLEARFLQIIGRAEWRVRLNDAVRLIAGVDLYMLPFEFSFTGPPPRQGEGAGIGDPLAREQLISVNQNDFVIRPGMYIESDLRPIEALQILLGLRLDYYHEIEAWSFDPRVVARLTVAEGWTLKAGLGIYSQPPEIQESHPAVGNPDLEPIQSVHAGLGVEHELDEGITLGVEGFYKHLFDRVIGVEGGREPFFENGGIGRIYGLEVAGRINPGEGRLFGLLSYTLSRSERRDQPDDPWRPFDYDQTHILNIAALYRLPRNWEIGGTLRLVSGNPFTPVTSAIYDANNDIYIPIGGDINGSRNPLFHRLDVRVEKKWIFEHWNFALFLDIQNAYNARNREGLIYSHDYRERRALRGLPIIPALGIRGEL